MVLKEWPYVDSILWDPVTQHPTLAHQSQVLLCGLHVPSCCGYATTVVRVWLAASSDHTCCGCAGVGGRSPAQLSVSFNCDMLVCWCVIQTLVWVAVRPGFCSCRLVYEY